MLRMLEDNNGRFAYALEDIEPFKGEPMRIELNSEHAILSTSRGKWSGTSWGGNARS